MLISKIETEEWSVMEVIWKNNDYLNERGITDEPEEIMNNTFVVTQKI